MCFVTSAAYSQELAWPVPFYGPLWIAPGASGYAFHSVSLWEVPSTAYPAAGPLTDVVVSNTSEYLGTVQVTASYSGGISGTLVGAAAGCTLQVGHWFYDYGVTRNSEPSWSIDEEVGYQKQRWYGPNFRVHRQEFDPYYGVWYDAYYGVYISDIYTVGKEQVFKVVQVPSE